MGSKGSTTTKQSFSLPPEFRAAYKKSIDMATQATASPYEAYTGQLVAGMNPTQQQGIANVNAAQGMALPAISQGIDLTRRAAQGITPELYQQFYSPYTRDVANATMANLMESSGQQRSGLKSGAIQAGAFGGDRSGIAQAEMARQQNLALGQTMGNIYNQGYGQAMQLAGQQAQNYGAMGQQLAGLGVGAQGSVLQGAQAQMAAGAQQQATDQAQLQAAYEQWMQRQAYPYQQAQFFANIAQGLGAGAGGTSSTTTPGPSLGSQILGGLGAVGSIFSMSDKRVKENIEAVGTLNDGQTIYRYNFKGDPKTQIGLLAQEVETREPGAVTDVKGLKMVDYKDATDKAASMGGLVTPNMQREAFAAGGSGGPSFYPYASLGYVPEGKIQSQSDRIPNAPPPFEDKGLAEDWQSMKPLTDEQVGGLKALVAKMGLSPSEESEVFKSLGDVEYGADNEDYARGGLVGRHGYALAGSVEDEEAGLSAAPQPMAGEGEGLAAAEEAPRSRLDMGRLFASEENPSIIETVMGRRLSPAARAAVMNASFAMMAGRSPFMGVNIGEAGKVGAQTYYNALAQERELAKQKSDIGLRGYEAETGRMGVEAQERNAQRQLAALILPIIRNYMALGQPVPPQYLNMLNQAFPPGSAARQELDSEMQPPAATAQPEIGDVSLEAIPGEGGEEAAVPLEIPAPEGAATPAPVAAEDELRSIYDKLPQQQNPYYWEQRAKMAEAAANAELANQYREKADEIRKADYERGYFNVPGQGRVPYPGKLEQELDVSGAKEEQNIAIKALDEAETEIQKMQSGFSQKTLTLNGLADALSRGETGALSELKAYTINILNSFGMAGAEEVEQAQNIQEIVRYLGEALASNPDVKQNFGPQISNADIKIMMGVQGSIADLPGANRRVVGAALGKLAWDKQKVRAWTEFSQQARESGKRLTRSDITQFNMDFSDGKYTDGKTSSDYVREAIANTPVMGEINWSDPNPSRLKKGYKYIVPKGSYPIGTVDKDTVVMWDGEKLVEVE